MADPRRYRFYSWYQEERRRRRGWLTLEEWAAFDAGHARYPEVEEPPPGRKMGEHYHAGWRCAEHEDRRRRVEAAAEKRAAQRRADRSVAVAREDLHREKARRAGIEGWREGLSLRGLQARHRDDGNGFLVRDLREGWMQAQEEYLKSLKEGRHA